MAPSGDRREPGYEFVAATSNGIDDKVSSVELAARRTGMSFQRTRMSADRTLMSVIRTSMSLITFGFTISEFFRKLEQAKVISGGAPSRNFGVSLIYLGIVMLVVGIIYHIRFMLALRDERQRMAKAGLIHAESGFPVSMTLIVAILLFGIGILAVMTVSRSNG